MLYNVHSKYNQLETFFRLCNYVFIITCRFNPKFKTEIIVSVGYISYFTLWLVSIYIYTSVHIYAKSTDKSRNATATKRERR